MVNETRVRGDEMKHIFKKIHSVEDWFLIAPPKEKEKHWVDGRSAKELAKAWFPKPRHEETPREFKELLESRPEISGIEFEEAEPELVTHFDNCGGEGRNADLVLLGQANGKKILVSVEAKADEEFGLYATDHIRKRKMVEGSRVPERFSLMCQGLFARKEPEACDLRYQLLTATCGTLVEAEKRGADIAVFVIHEFIGKTKDKKMRKNSDDLNRFIQVLSSGKAKSILPGQLLGPFYVPGNKYFPGKIPLYIGKCRRIVKQETD